MLGDPTTGAYWARLYGVNAAKMDDYISLFLTRFAPEVYLDPSLCRFSIQRLLEDGRFTDPELRPSSILAG